MIQMDTVRRLLAAADVGKDAYAVAEAAGALLSANANDVVARVHYARAMAALGLGTAARRVIENVSEIPDSLKGGIVAAPPGTTAWSSRGRRFAANVAAIASRWPELAKVFEENMGGTPMPQGLANFELHLAGDGNAFVLDKRLPVWSGWLGLANHRAGIAAWKFDKAKTPMQLPILFDGIGYGWLLPQVFATTAESFLNYSCAIHIFEPDVCALAMALHVQDFVALFGSPRVHLHIGAGAEEKLRRELETNLDLTAPGQIISQPLTMGGAKRAGGVAQKIVESCGAARSAAQAKVNAEIAAYYQDKTPEFWAEKFARRSPLRVLGLTTRYSTVLKHSMEEMRAAVCSLGHDMCVAMEADDSSLENPALRMIAAFKPDVIFQLSRMRYENPGLPKNVPFVCWDQDNLSCMRTEGATRSLDTLTYVAGHGAVFGYGHLKWPAENCIFVHPAGATHRYSDAPAEKGLLEKHACDFSYVSNASEPPEVLAARLGVRWAREEAFERAWNLAVEEVTAESRAGACWDLLPLQQMLRKKNPAFVDGLVNEIAMDLKTLADRLFRHVTLEWVGAWCDAHGKSLRLYGKGWEQHQTLAKFAAGPAAQGEELRAVYQASKVNLQIIENGFIHSRSLDGMAAGGFFMTRRSAADGADVEALREISALGRWVNENGLISAEQIARTADPIVRGRWAKTLAHHPWGPEHAFKVLKVWGDVPQPSVAFEELSRISFGSAEEFGKLAQKFLADESARRSLAAQMRQRVLDEFSYSARWKKMISHVARQLGAIETTHARFEEIKQSVLCDAGTVSG